MQAPENLQRLISPEKLSKMGTDLIRRLER
jgi:hypothetical protein